MTGDKPVAQRTTFLPAADQAAVGDPSIIRVLFSSFSIFLGVLYRFVYICALFIIAICLWEPTTPHVSEIRTVLSS